LTKRPQNIVKMLPADWGDGYANVWLGATTEDQEHYEQRGRSWRAFQLWCASSATSLH
jgi:protein gp37